MIPQAEIKKDEFEDVDLQYKEDDKNEKWYDKMLLNHILKITAAFLLIAVVTPLLLYQFLYLSGVDLHTSDGFSLGSCLIARESRVPCGYGDITAEECHSQCCYDFSNNMCFHRFPSRFSFIMDRIWSENITLKPRVATVPYKNQNSVTNLRLSIDEISATHLAFTYYDSTNVTLNGSRLDDEKDYSYEIASPELNVIVNSNRGHTIFDTLRGPLVASKDIWEITFRLTNETMYGFGEIPIKNDSVKMLYNNKDGYSGIPLIFAKSNGTFHGLLIDIVEPTEVVFMGLNAIIVRSINNFGLKFHIFSGPKPSDIMKDVMKFMQFENDFEYWMLGAHFCSEPENATEITYFIQEADRHNMTYDSHCVTPIVFENSCEHSQKTLVTEGASLYKNAGKRFVPHLSPHVIYKESALPEPESNETESRSTDCYLDFANFTEYVLNLPDSTEMYKGKVNLSDVIYPYYENMSQDFLNELWLGVDFDGIILENSWGIDDSEKFVNETHNYLPYFSDNFENVTNCTLRWNTTDNKGVIHFYRHNEYGNHFAKSIELIKQVPTWSASQWMNSKIYIHRQNIQTSWTNLNKELVEAALGSVSGQWFWSSPVCGDTENFNPETQTSLCTKWYLASTYLPIINIQSKGERRDPLSFSAFQKDLMINALRNRIMLAPYFFTTLQKGPLIRPMFYQFPEIEELHDLTNQFGIGDDLMIVPNLQPYQSMVHFSMPAGTWYELWSGLKLESSFLQVVTMYTTDSDFLVLLRAGAVIVLQKDVKLTAEKTRAESSLSLKIALNCTNEYNTTDIGEANVTTTIANCTASGELYLDEGRTVIFEATHETLKITRIGDSNEFCEDTAWSTVINEIEVYGLDETLNNFDYHKNIVTAIDLCDLKENGEILFDFT